MFYLFIILFLQNQSAIDSRYSLAYDYVVNLDKLRSEIIPFINANDTVNFVLPFKLEVSPLLRNIYLSSFPSIYLWEYPDLDKKSALDSLVALSKLEKEYPKIDSTCISIAKLTNSKNAKYILFFSLIKDNKLIASVYPIAMGGKDHKTVSRFTRGCEFVFIFSADGSIKNVHYQLSHIN